jgi:hypothetical protein
MARPAHAPAATREQRHAAGREQDLRPRTPCARPHAAGQRAFGENYVQEALDKIDALADLRRSCSGT